MAKNSLALQTFHSVDNILLEIVRAPAVQPVSPPSRDELLDVEVGDEVSA